MATTAYAASAVTYAAPTPTVPYAAPLPAIIYAAPAPAITYASPLANQAPLQAAGQAPEVYASGGEVPYEPPQQLSDQHPQQLSHQPPQPVEEVCFQVSSLKHCGVSSDSENFCLVFKCCWYDRRGAWTVDRFGARGSVDRRDNIFNPETS